MMSDLAHVETKLLRAELARREEELNAERWRQIREHYGPCPKCGAEVTELDSRVTQEHWSAPGWQGWPMPPPADWPGRQLDAQEWATELSCANGHVRYETDVRIAAVREP